MSKVLVTGADGFIGSHLVERLVRDGHEVRALSYYNSFNFWGWLEDLDAEVEKSVEVVTGDVRDPRCCNEIVQGVSEVYNLAALIAIPYSYRAPDSYVDTNIRGTINICNAAQTSNVDRIVQTSTSEVYGTALYVPIDEKHPMQPQSPYSATKIGSDSMALSYFNSFELPVTVVRPFNTFGPRQSARAVIPSIIIQMLNKKEEIRLGALSPTRDFNFVEDTARGIAELAKCTDAIGEVVNIGSGTEYSIKETFELIAELTNSSAKYVCEQERIRPEKSEVERLLCDNTKAKKLFGYEPQYSFRQGLEKTIEWFSKGDNLKKYKDIYNV